MSHSTEAIGQTIELHYGFFACAVLETCQQVVAQATLPLSIQRFVEDFDGTENTSIVVARSPIPDIEAYAIVKKLTEMGVLVPKRKAPPTDFSSEEEAFFAAEVEPIDACELPFESTSDKLRSALRRARIALRR